MVASSTMKRYNNNNKKYKTNVILSSCQLPFSKRIKWWKFLELYRVFGFGGAGGIACGPSTWAVTRTFKLQICSIVFCEYSTRLSLPSPLQHHDDQLYRDFNGGVWVSVHAVLKQRIPVFINNTQWSPFSEIHVYMCISDERLFLYFLSGFQEGQVDINLS